MILILILGFALGAVAVVFILQNTAVVALSFLQWQFESSLALVVIFSLLVGAVLTLLLTLPGAIGDSMRMRKLSKHNNQLAKEAQFQKQSADESAAQLAMAQQPQYDPENTLGR